MTDKEKIEKLVQFISDKSLWFEFIKALKLEGYNLVEQNNNYFTIDEKI